MPLARSIQNPKWADKFPVGEAHYIAQNSAAFQQLMSSFQNFLESRWHVYGFQDVLLSQELLQELNTQQHPLFAPGKYFKPKNINCSFISYDF